LIAETEAELHELQAPAGSSEEPVTPAEGPDLASGAVPASATVSSRVQASPAARAKAQALGVDLDGIAGTGPGGLITADDVAAAAGVGTEPEGSAETAVGRTIRARVRLTGMRRVIAEHVMTSLQSTAQATSWFSVDATTLTEFRSSFDPDVRPSYPAILVGALARTLRNHPAFNASIYDDTALIWDCINVGVAVGFARPGEFTDALVVPVLRDADTKSVASLSQELAEKTRAAQAGTLPIDDLQGGTFTLSSVGNVRNVVWNGSTPVLNGDETGILWAGAVRAVPVVRDGAVVAGSELPIALTQDHRLVDGIAAGRFIGELTELLESPAALRELKYLSGAPA
jgi:pyruvate/2-oxoglutarate dehydrogenase complex dihydrolipoamide acyltransferase (E2) component